DYQTLAKTLDLATFIELALNHKIDPFKYKSYEVIKAYITNTMLERLSNVNYSDAFKQTFDRLKESDKEKIIGDLKRRIFIKPQYGDLKSVDGISLKRFIYLAGKEKADEYLNSLGIEEKKTLMRQAMNHF